MLNKEKFFLGTFPKISLGLDSTNNLRSKPVDIFYSSIRKFKISLETLSDNQKST